MDTVSRRHFLFGRTATKLGENFASDTRGATAIEYGLIGALIGIAIIPAARGLGIGVRRKLRGCVHRTLRGRTPAKHCEKK